MATSAKPRGRIIRRFIIRADRISLATWTDRSGTNLPVAMCCCCKGRSAPFSAASPQRCARPAQSSVHKINFCGGDWLFYRDGSVNYYGTLDDWPAWLERLPRAAPDRRAGAVRRLPAGALGGDQRRRRPRPDLLGVRGRLYPAELCDLRAPRRQRLLRRCRTIRRTTRRCRKQPRRPSRRSATPSTGARCSRWPTTSPARFGMPWFRHRVHHRSLNMFEGFVWWRSYYRKLVYAAEQAPLLDAPQRRAGRSTISWSHCRPPAIRRC